MRRARLSTTTTLAQLTTAQTQPRLEVPEPVLTFAFGGATGRLSAPGPGLKGGSIKDAIVRWLDEQL